MTAADLKFDSRPARITTGWRELWLKEDWWAIYLGLGLVIAGVVLFASGSSLKWLAVTPAIMVVRQPVGRRCRLERAALSGAARLLARGLLGGADGARPQGA